ncbi:MAG: hypothetical protein O9327_03215 [Polaromonas sp.]|nr:hypothetical protein [Polaromonas sp.]
MNPTAATATQDHLDGALPRVITREEIAQDLSDLVVQNLRCQSKMLMADDIGERQALTDLIQVTKGRMQIALDALDGNLEPYLWMRGDLQTQAALNEPTSPANDADRLDFETIRDVVGMARQMALDNFHRQALSLADAADEPSRQVGIGLLDDAEKQARMADAAFRALIAAEAANRACLISMCRHSAGTADQLVAAEIQAASSRNQLRVVANELDGFSTHAQRSQGMTASILRAAASDHAGASRDHVVKLTQGFADNLRGFAERVRRFGDSLAQTPALVQQLANDSKMSLAKVATHAVKVAQGGFERTKERVWAVLEKAGARILAAEHKIVATAQAATDEFAIHGDMALQAAGRLREAAFHGASRAAGLGARIVDISAAAIQGAARAAATNYQTLRDESKERVVQRRMP